MRTRKEKITAFIYNHVWLKYLIDYGVTFIMSVFSAAIFAFGVKCFLDPSALGGEMANSVTLVSGGSSGVAQVFLLTLETCGVNIENRSLIFSIAYFVVNIPLIILAEIGIIAIPFIFHIVYGIYIVYFSKLNLKYQYYRNWMFILQRVTAIITTVFVIEHVVFVRIMTASTMDVMTAMAHVVQTPLGFALELIGIWASVFHFSNGIFTFLITWGVIQGERLQKLFSVLTILLCAGMFLWTLIILIRIAMMPI